MKLSSPIAVQLEGFCEETGLTKTMAIEKILSQFLVSILQRRNGTKDFEEGVLACRSQ